MTVRWKKPVDGDKMSKMARWLDTMPPSRRNEVIVGARRRVLANRANILGCFRALIVFDEWFLVADEDP